jgi:hypothetical protein
LCSRAARRSCGSERAFGPLGSKEIHVGFAKRDLRRIGDLAPRIERCPVGPPFENIDPFRIERVGADMQVDTSALPSRAFDPRLKRGDRRIAVRSLCQLKEPVRKGPLGL